MIFNPIVPKMEPQVSKKWVWNDELTVSETTLFNVSFNSNNGGFSSFQITSDNMIYYTGSSGGGRPYVVWYGGTDWASEAYKTIVFDEAPSEDLLTFLQANATPIVE